jgi:Mg2+/citrate symporter
MNTRTTLVVISTDCTGSKFNYNTITASLIFIEDKQLTINRYIFSLILQLNEAVLKMIEWQNTYKNSVQEFEKQLKITAENTNE